MEKTLIAVESLSKQHVPDSHSGVRNVSFSVPSGTIIAIVGESGSGKSTLLKLIYGLLTPDSGRVTYNGVQILGPDEKLIPGHDRMKMVTQDFALNTYAKVYDNIASLLSNADLKGKKAKTEQMMDLLRIRHLAMKRVADLSGGEQQRVAIARAMVTGPEVLLLDEPFSQVDTVLRDQLRGDLRRLNEQTGATILLVSHDPVDGLSLADELIVLKDGELIGQGKPADLYARPTNTYTARLLAGSNILTAAEAGKLGIDSGGKEIAVHPEWIRIKYPETSEPFHVKKQVFKGATTDLLIERGGVSLWVQLLHTDEHIDTSQVGVKIRKWVAF